MPLGIFDIMLDVGNLIVYMNWVISVLDNDLSYILLKSFILNSTKSPLIDPIKQNENIYHRVHFNSVNTLRPKQNGHYLADDTFKHIFLNKNVRILIKISLKFISKGPINNIPALVQMMAG